MRENFQNKEHIPHFPFLEKNLQGQKPGHTFRKEINNERAFHKI